MASREGDEFGWKWWCEDNRFQLSSLQYFFRFTLTPSARILTLSKPEGLISLLKLHSWEPSDYTELFEFEEKHKGHVPPMEILDRWFAPNLCYLDFEKLSESYDAVELTNSGALNDCLGMWDCDSIVVFRPEVVEVISGKA